MESRVSAADSTQGSVERDQQLGVKNLRAVELVTGENKSTTETTTFVLKPGLAFRILIRLAKQCGAGSKMAE
jgi:hypothetical protein